MTDSKELYAFDVLIARDRNARVVGLDEAGRGPLAGPVVAAACILDYDSEILAVNDSKKLTAAKRDILFDQIIAKAKAYSIAEASWEEIDSLNILNASLLAMHRALMALPKIWSLALVDGNTPITALPQQQQLCVVKGDAQSACIGAASILAKVTRDRIMIDMHSKYPEYGFDIHKGYPTPAHIKILKERGMTPIHRRSFSIKFVAQTTLEL